MSRAVNWVTGGFIALAAMGSGCVTQPPESEQASQSDMAKDKKSAMTQTMGGSTAGSGSAQVSASGAAAGSGDEVTVAAAMGYDICPAEIGAARLIIFEGPAWATHLAAAGDRAGDLAAWKPEFSRHSIVLIALGEKPSLGHSIKIADTVRVNTGRLMIPVKHTAPAPGMMSAMALSTPCVYVQLETTDVGRIDVIDTDSGEIMQRWSR